MFGLILSISFILVLLFIIFKPKFGVCFFIAYSFLVPIMKLQIGSFSIGSKFTSLILLIVVFAKYSKKLKYISLRPLYPFLILYIGLLILSLMGDVMTFSESFNSFTDSFLIDIMTPLSLYVIIMSEPTSIKLVKRSMIIIFFVILVYALLLLYIPGVNPYMLLISQLYPDLKYVGDYYDVALSGRMFGRISSVFYHPMQFGVVLGLIVLYSTFMKKYNLLGRKMYLLIILPTFICILFCGVRTPIVALLGALCVYLFLNRKFSLLLKFGLGICLILFILSFFPEMEDYALSIFHSNDSQVGGSSLAMRMKQLDGCFDEITNNPLFGHGYGWRAFYQEHYGDHPVILAFESVLFVTLCESGLLGVLLWIFVILYFFKINNNSDFISLLSYFILYILITGEFGFQYFMMIYVIMYAIKSVDLKNKSIHNYD